MEDITKLLFWLGTVIYIIDFTLCEFSPSYLAWRTHEAPTEIEHPAAVIPSGAERSRGTDYTKIREAAEKPQTLRPRPKRIET